MTRQEIQDFTLRITHANSTQMIVILYDIILTYTKDCRKCLEDGDIKAFRIEITNLRNAFKELMDSVDTSIDLGLNLIKLYVFCTQQITKADTNSDPSYLENVEHVIAGLKESYNEIAPLDKSEAIMGNTEKVYAGLTYNPYGQSENMVENSTSRGYLA